MVVVATLPPPRLAASDCCRLESEGPLGSRSIVSRLGAGVAAVDDPPCMANRFCCSAAIDGALVPRPRSTLARGAASLGLSSVRPCLSAAIDDERLVMTTFFSSVAAALSASTCCCICETRPVLARGISSLTEDVAAEASGAAVLTAC